MAAKWQRMRINKKNKKKRKNKRTKKNTKKDGVSTMLDDIWIWHVALLRILYKIILSACCFSVFILFSLLLFKKRTYDIWFVA